MRSARLNLPLAAGGTNSPRWRQLLGESRRAVLATHLQGRERLHSGTSPGHLVNLQQKIRIASTATSAAVWDRAVWVQDRAQRRLKAELARLEKELQQMDEASFSAGPTGRLPVWDDANFKMALPSTKPMSHKLLAILLMIGCVESNPGPSSDRMDSAESASGLVPAFVTNAPECWDAFGKRGRRFENGGE
ncbi:hypothetical protein KFL_010100010 [Klebsormidium nitens]|uniref:Uncharacterized protein n=1 Tax=Klebsormidium nitens TaxID=105231 RepID=A0A1Y1INE7_KLENI|nr:hypothetical protein KFL_010100010 [Klebsormidium nitens]|eukprot:GAQ92410.1 hypothetical protein KFL_010100010 [Klebsormidium nitens]